MAIINIKDLYEQVFRISPRYIIPNYADLRSQIPEYSAIEIFTEEENIAELTEFGTPILEKIVLEPGVYNKAEIDPIKRIPVLRQVNFPGYIFPGWPMIDVRQNKILVKTTIIGRPGTVKEQITPDDHQITIRGVLIGDGNDYPYAAKRDFKAMFDEGTAYGVTSRTLNDLGIFNVVFEGIDFSDIEGYNNVCAYSIDAVSDEPILIEIKNLKK